MKKTNWYCTSDDELGNALTENAPPKAVKSYNEFCKSIIEIDKNGNEWLIER